MCNLFPPATLGPLAFLPVTHRVGCHSLLRGIFPTQGINLGLLRCRRILYHLSHRGFSLSEVYLFYDLIVSYTVILWFRKMFKYQGKLANIITVEMFQNHLGKLTDRAINTKVF